MVIPHRDTGHVFLVSYVIRKMSVRFWETEGDSKWDCVLPFPLTKERYPESKACHLDVVVHTAPHEVHICKNKNNVFQVIQTS